MYSRHVPLRSGGSLVIDSTEAVVAIDVNSGKFRDHSDAETTAFKTDMEAADEIPRQLRLRDLGGVIICDFIDLRFERHRRELWKRLNDNFKNDRAKTKVLPMSEFGIIEMTRQRMRPSLKRSIYFDCPHCKGAGLVKTPESMSLDVMRRLAIALTDQRVVRVELAICTDVAFYLQNRKRIQIADMEANTRKRVIIRSDPALGLDEMRLDPFDSRDGLVIIEELSAVLSPPPHTTQLGIRPQQRPPGNQRPQQQGRLDDRRPRGGPPGRPQLPPPRAAAPRDEAFDLDHEEDDFEQRSERDDRGEREDHDDAVEDVEIEAGAGVELDEPTDDVPQREPFAPALDTEAGSEAAEDSLGNRAEAPLGDTDQADDGGPRRRRRRRGRRGRGRGGQNAQGQAPGPRTDDSRQDGPRLNEPRRDVPRLNAPRTDERRPPQREFDRDEIRSAPDDAMDADEMTPVRDEDDFPDEPREEIAASEESAAEIDAEIAPAGGEPIEIGEDGAPRSADAVAAEEAAVAAVPWRQRSARSRRLKSLANRFQRLRRRDNCRSRCRRCSAPDRRIAI